MEHLYHYTNLETLKLILQNKTFRLSSLNRMDDLEEGDTVDFQKLGRFTYISSWTNNPNESLLLWSYSRGNDGVRLRMRTNIFKTEKVNESIFLHGMPVSIEDEFNLGILKLMKNENVSFAPPRATLVEVTYTNLERLLKPNVLKRFPDGHFNLTTQDLGLFKRLEWSDQKEWRYRLSSIPLNIKEMVAFVKDGRIEILLDKIRIRDDLGFIDLPLKDDAFDDLEILCGPQMSDERKDEVRRVLALYAPNAVSRNSSLRIRP